MRIFTILLLLISFTVSFAQQSGNSVISGKVIDYNLNLPIEYANVVLYKQQDSSMVDGTISDSSGTFQLSKIPYGKYYIAANFIGYEKMITPDLELNKETPFIDLKELKIVQAIENIEGVEVVGEKSYVEYKIDKKVVNVSKHVNAAGGTAADVLENVPSVVVDIEGNVSLRGSSNFTVLIDGKPTVMSGNDLLKQIPANVIENIEIITNPSAKYDPDGTSGIINLVMKKEKRNGFNGIVNLTAATMNKYGGDFQLNLRKEKVNYFISANYNRNTGLAETENYRETYFSDTTSYLMEKTDRKNTQRPWRINLGADYYLSDKNTLTVSGTYGGFGYFREFNTKYHLWDDVSSYDDFSISDNIFEIDGVYFSASVNFQHDFAQDEHKFVVSVSGWQWDGKDIEESNEQTTDFGYTSLGLLSKMRSTHNPVRNNLRAKVDYTKPFSKGKLEAGIQTHITSGTSNFVYENLDPDFNDWVFNSQYSNEMLFDRNLYSGYTTFSSQFFGFSYQAGLRVEYTDRLLHQKTTDEKYDVEILKYYPSCHITRQLPANQQVQLSYSRRINRPQPWELNPFPNYSDSYNFSMGNPLLKPEDIDSYEFNYMNRMKKSFLSLGLFYRHTNNTKLYAIDIDEADPNVVFITYKNLDKTYAYGTELMFNYDPYKWLNINLGGNLYKYNIEADIYDQSIDLESTSWDSRLTAAFKISSATRVQLTGVYVSPGIEGQGTKEEYYVANLSVRHDFLERKASVSLNVRDIFATGIYEVETKYEDFYSHFIYKNEAPVIRISLTYRINNYKRRQDSDADSGIGR
ncbi:MAG: TonB-dependent receptor [Bacteroidetes bacterium]|nr:TonB-dependent receptor [Bacteroidota bacterium]